MYSLLKLLQSDAMVQMLPTTPEHQNTDTKNITRMSENVGICDFN